MNKKIAVVGFIIVGGGLIKAWTANPPQAITPVIIGGYVFILLLALLDAFGGPLGNLAGALAIVAGIYVVLTEYVPILQLLGGIVAGPNLKTSPGASYPPNQH